MAHVVVSKWENSAQSQQKVAKKLAKIEVENSNSTVEAKLNTYSWHSAFEVWSPAEYDEFSIGFLEFIYLEGHATGAFHTFEKEENSYALHYYCLACLLSACKHTPFYTAITWG